MSLTPAISSPGHRGGIPARKVRGWSDMGGYFVLFAAVLLGSMALRFPLVYNFQFFGFYDPGTAFHALDLLAKNYSPTVDFGYTHGLLSLEFSRLWFGVFGKSPLAFVFAVTMLQMVIALGLARLAARFQLNRISTALFCCLLPWAVIPDYLTLTHPLEAALLVHALAEQSAGRRSRALAILTVCLAVKPSMAYVYGFVLTLMMLRDHLTREDLFLGRRLRRFVIDLLPALVAGVLVLLFLLARYGPVPVKNTLFAVAGVSAYKETNFGLFLGDGREFWLPTPAQAGLALPYATPFALLNWPLYYVLTPAGIWIVAVASLLLLGGFYGLGYLSRGSHNRPAAHETVVTLALIHTAFLLVFYGWKLSWTYYAYMPFFALCLGVHRLNFHRRGTALLIALAATSHTRAVLDAFAIWAGGVRAPETAGLYAWANHLQSFREAVALTQGRPTLLLTNGYPFDLPPNIAIPDAWFPEAGIATPREIERVHKQTLDADFIIIFHPYGHADLWHNPRFADARAAFEPVPIPSPKYPGSTPFQNSHFEVYRRIKPN